MSLPSKIVSPQDLESWYRENRGLDLYQQGCRILDPIPYYFGVLAFRLEREKMEDPNYRSEVLFALQKWQEKIYSVIGVWNTREDFGENMNPQCDAGRQNLWTWIETRVRKLMSLVEEAEKLEKR